MSSMKSISRHKSFRFDLTLILACVYFFASLLMFLIFKINNKCSFWPFSLFIRFPLSSSFLRSPRGPWVGGGHFPSEWDSGLTFSQSIFLDISHSEKFLLFTIQITMKNWWKMRFTRVSWDFQTACSWFGFFWFSLFCEIDQIHKSVELKSRDNISGLIRLIIH